MTRELPLEEIRKLVGTEVYVSGWKEEQKGGRILITTTHTIEIEGQEKPACVAESLALVFV